MKQSESTPVRLAMSGDLVVRKEPSTGAATIPLRLDAYEKLTVCETISHPTDFDWLQVEKHGMLGWLEEEYTVLQSVFEFEGKNLLPGTEKIDRFNSLPPGYRPDDLAVVPRELSIGEVVLLRPAAIAAFERLIHEARNAGVQLAVFSGHREAEYQRGLYLKQIELEGPKQRYVARPCHSEHQLGTAADLVGEDESLAAEAAFADTPEAFWIQKNCGRFGLRLSYREDNQEITGYLPEPWHLRYVGLDNV